MRISRDVRTVATQDGGVLMDIHGGLMFSLNPIGSLIWQQLADGNSAVQIAEHLACKFGIPRDRALADVNEFIGQLEAQHLLRESESEDSRRAPGPQKKRPVL